jgi:hypothetical protein
MRQLEVYVNEVNVAAYSLETEAEAELQRRLAETADIIALRRSQRKTYVI